MLPQANRLRQLFSIFYRYRWRLSVIFPFLLRPSLVERRIEGVKILAVEVVGSNTKSFAEALVMNDLTLSQKAYRVDNVGIIAKPQDIIVGCAGFLLREGCLSTAIHGRVNL